MNNVAQQEQDADNIHNRMHLAGLATDDLDHGVGNAAESDTVGNAVAEGHHYQGEESGDGDLNVRPVDFLQGTAHHNAYDHQDRSGSAGRHKAQQRHRHNSDQEADTSGQAGQTGLTAFRDTRAGFHIGGNGGGTQNSARGGGDGIGQQSAVRSGQVAVLIQEAALAGSAYQSTDSIEHIHHGQRQQHRNDREDHDADAFAGAEQLTEAIGKSACGGEIKVKGEGYLLGHTNIEAQRVLHDGADHRSNDDTDQQAALNLPNHQRDGDDQADHRQDHGRIVEGSQSDRSRFAGNYDSGVFKADESDKQADTAADSLFQGHGNRVNDRGTQASHGNQDKDDTGHEHGSQTSLPREAHSTTNGISEESVQAHTGGQSERIVGQEAH